MNDQFLTNLILQRTRPFIALGGKDALGTWTRTGQTEQLAAFLRGGDLVRQYTDAAMAEIAEDVETYCKIIKSASGTLVSIGPGNGIAEVMLWQRFGFDQIILIDTENTGTHRHGYNKQGSGYCDLAATAEYLTGNGVVANIATWNPNNGPCPEFGQFDVLISMYSMGFHFPRESYNEFIRALAKPAGLVLYDLRKIHDVGYPPIGFSARRHILEGRDVIALRRSRVL